MTDQNNEQQPLVEAIECAETPLEAAESIGRLSVGRVISDSIQTARNVATIIINGDAGEAIRAVANGR